MFCIRRAKDYFEAFRVTLERFCIAYLIYFTFYVLVWWNFTVNIPAFVDKFF